MTSLMNLKKFGLSPVNGQSNSRTSSVVNCPRSGVNCSQNGFTLLELLIVIAIIAILSIALVFMLNPAETLKKARDAQRISDLKTVKTALGVFLTSASSTLLSLDSTTNTASSTCLTKNDGTPQQGKIAYSGGTSGGLAPTISSTAQGSDGGGNGSPNFAITGFLSSTPGRVDGFGWIPVNLKGLTSGTPISSFPTDPVNAIESNGSASSTSLVYRYACQNASGTTGKPAYLFEIDAVLESNAYKVEDNKMKNDGGDNDNYYETGNSLNLLPAGPYIGF